MADKIWGEIALISIRKAASDMDRMEELLDTLSAGYEQAVRSAGQYAIELDEEDAAAYREHLEKLRSKLKTAETIEDWKAVEACFRGELRDYRDRAQGHLLRLRNETRAAASAMQLFADSITTNSTDHEEQLQRAVQQLKSLTKCETLSQVKTGIQGVTHTIVDSLTVLRRGHQMAVAQLRDEINLLHKKLAAERDSSHLDPTSGVWNREKLDSQMADLIQKDQAFCALLIHIRHLKRLSQQYSPRMIEAGLKALLQRLTAQLGDKGVVGRWSDENFLAIMQLDHAAAMRFSREAGVRLSGNYSIQENGLAKNISIQAVTGVIERPIETSSLVFQQRLLQTCQTLGGTTGGTA